MAENKTGYSHDNTLLSNADQQSNKESDDRNISYDDALLHAVQESNNESVVRALIDAGADVNETNEYGENALFYAVPKSNNESVVRALIDAGADVNKTYKYGQTALLYAIQQSNNESVVRALIDAGADVNITNDYGKTALFKAVQQSNNESVVRALIDAGADVNETKEYGETALFYAVLQSNNESVVRALIDAGADVNITNNDGKTALFKAVQKSNNESVIRALIDTGADVNKTYKYGQTALLYAIQQSNNENVVRALIDAGADVNETNEYGQTALFYAVQQSNNESLVRTLIDAGADVNKTDKYGQIALFKAVQKSNNERVVRALIDAGADVNITNDDGKSVLFKSVQQSNNERVVRALINAGADVNITNDDGKTALFKAVQQSNNERVVRALIAAGADVNITYEYGQTALFYAVKQSNNESVVAALIDAGADVNITDEYGQTALFHAVGRSNNERVVRSLVNYSNDIFTERNCFGRTALFYADWSYFSTESYIMEKGGRRCLQLKDNCNVDILTLLFEKYATSRVQRFDAEVLIEHGVKRESLAKTVLNIMFRKSVTYPVFTVKRNLEILLLQFSLGRVSDADHGTLLSLFDLYREFIDDDNFSERKLKMENIIQLLKQGVPHNTPKVLELLVELGANSNSADSDGNTAVHHAVRLPFLGASEELVLRLCHQLGKHDAQFNTRNHQNQTPLLFCLSGDISHLTERELPTAIKTVRKMCMFLLKSGSSVEETSRSGESVFHLILKLFQVGLNLIDETIRQEFLQEVIELLQLFPRAKVFKRNVVNKSDVHLDTPLHLWAKLEINESPEGYSSGVIKDCCFEEFLQIVFNHLLGCGAKLLARNENDATPLHMCNTWNAVKILIKAGANPKDVDALGQTPLLVAAKKGKAIFRNLDRFFLDVSEDPKPFWKNCIEKGLDPLAVDKRGESVLGILVHTETFVLAKALVDVACEMSYTKSETVTTDLLNAICKDKSTRTYWKTNLVQDILKSRKCPTAAVTPLRFCCGNIIEEAKSQNEPKLCSTVHCEILKFLRLYGASSESCLDMAETCPALKDLLTKPVDIDTVLIPWTSVSDKHEDKLAKVARRQECHVVSQFWLHNDYIGCGSFGHVFAGINDKDGREVAVKRIEKLKMQRPEESREIINLTALADCEHVLRYLQFFDDEDEKFSYVVLELMEGHLDDYLTGSTHDTTKGTELCEDVIKGMAYLHEKKILHRDLKPGNILFKLHPKLCLKIADFGLSLRMDLKATTVYGTNAGTRCWIAPEVLKSKMGHCKSTDMFSCGLLLHYILSVKKHPFSPAVCAGKGEYQIAHETESNTMKGEMEGWDKSLFPEATHLVRSILGNAVKDRPTAAQALDHPMFWSNKKKIDFLTAVGNQSVFEFPRAGKSTCLSAIEADLETTFMTIVRKGAWDDPGYVHMPVIFAEMKKKRTYDVHSAVELVRFIRNGYSHVSEHTRPTAIRKLLLEDFVVLEYFPDLVIEVYKVVNSHGWDQTKDEVKYRR